MLERALIAFVAVTLAVVDAGNLDLGRLVVRTRRRVVVESAEGIGTVGAELALDELLLGLGINLVALWF